MATLSSLPQAFIFHWSQRPKSRTEIPAISTPRSPAHLKALPTAAPNFRLCNVRNSHRLRGLRIVSASNTNPTEQDAPTEKGDGGVQGPPFLTILAGVVVFLLICWAVGSIVMWLIGLIVNVLSS
ncbi:hypothetical protein AAC387_Pa07g1150 [Persea americana]